MGAICETDTAARAGRKIDPFNKFSIKFMPEPDRVSNLTNSASQNVQKEFEIVSFSITPEKPLLEQHELAIIEFTVFGLTNKQIARVFQTREQEVIDIKINIFHKLISPLKTVSYEAIKIATLRNEKYPEEQTVTIPTDEKSITRDSFTTEHQREIMYLTVRGYTNSQIGHVLGITKNTVRNIKAAISKQLGLVGPWREIERVTVNFRPSLNFILTDTEKEIFELKIKGHQNKEIAIMVKKKTGGNKSLQTIKNHLSQTFKKLRINSIKEGLNLARNLELFSSEEPEKANLLFPEKKEKILHLERIFDLTEREFEVFVFLSDFKGKRKQTADGRGIKESSMTQIIWRINKKLGTRAEYSSIREVSNQVFRELCIQTLEDLKIRYQRQRKKDHNHEINPGNYKIEMIENLTERQLEIAKFVADFKGSVENAAVGLGISYNTLKNSLNEIYGKIGITIKNHQRRRILKRILEKAGVLNTQKKESLSLAKILMELREKYYRNWDEYEDDIQNNFGKFNSEKIKELTQREYEILMLISHYGYSNEKTALALGITPVTVKNFLYSVFQKLGVDCRLHAALILFDAEEKRIK